MQPLSPEFSQDLIDAFDRMQPFPTSVQAIIRLTRDASCAPRDLVAVIDKDPIVTVKVLRVVNSAHYGLPRPITSVEHAIVFLGFNTIKNLALGIAALRMLPPAPQAAFDSAKYLFHSLSTAEMARSLGVRFDTVDSHDFFIAGLLHDFGKVVVAQVMPTAFNKAVEYSLWHEVSMRQALQDVAGIDHTQIGAMLLEKWRFSQALVQAIAWQASAQAARSPLAACVQAANQLSKQLGAEFAGSDKLEPLLPEVQALLGGSIDTLARGLGDSAALMQEARRFSDPVA